MRCWTHGLPYVVLNAWDSIPGVERTGIHTWCWTHRHPYLVLNAQASIPGVKHMDFHMWCWTHGIPYMVLKYLGFHTWCWIKAWTLEPWILKLHSSNLPAFHTAIMNLPDELATTGWALFNYSRPFQQSIGWALYRYGAMYFYIEKVNNISDCIYGPLQRAWMVHIQCNKLTQNSVPIGQVQKYQFQIQKYPHSLQHIALYWSIDRMVRFGPKPTIVLSMFHLWYGRINRKDLGHFWLGYTCYKDNAKFWDTCYRMLT